MPARDPACEEGFRLKLPFVTALGLPTGLFGPPPTTAAEPPPPAPLLCTSIVTLRVDIALPAGLCGVIGVTIGLKRADVSAVRDVSLCGCWVSVGVGVWVSGLGERRERDWGRVDMVGARERADWSLAERWATAGHTRDIGKNGLVKACERTCGIGLISRLGVCTHTGD